MGSPMNEVQLRAFHRLMHTSCQIVNITEVVETVYELHCLLRLVHTGSLP